MTLLLPSWTLPPENLDLTAHAVHLWLAGLDVAESQLSYLREMLSPDERQRAEKFTFDQHRTHFIAGRGFLRSILGRYLQIEPARIRFQYNARGKPALDPSLGINTLHFNLSHSNGLALFAFTQAGPIGVDIEHIRLQTDIEQTGALVFSSSELAALQSLSPEIRRITFFQFWTRKEAFMKAKGDGFSLPLREFDVSQAPEMPVLHIEHLNEQPRFTTWHVQDVSLLPGYVAAVAREGNEWPVSFFRMPDVYPF